MAHITLRSDKLPGISGLLDYARDTARPLMDLAETLLRGESTLTMGERELIAASVSYGNGCRFCFSSHAAAAAVHLGRDLDLLDEIENGLRDETVSPKMRALLAIAESVRADGRSVTAAQVEAARAEGATDREIHDTVLIAAAFSMYNRYVDGLGTWAPEEKEAYRGSGERLARMGYGRRE